MKSATKRFAGRAVDLLRRAELGDARRASITAMRSDRISASSWSWVTNSGGQAEPALQALHLELHLLAQLAVERAERLVEQQQARAEHDGARKRDALLLPARELARQAAAVSRKVDERERVGDPAVASPRAAPCASRAETRCSARRVMCGNSA